MRQFGRSAMKGISWSLMPLVHDYYFEPHHDEFVPRNLWSLSNAFTSAFKSLGPLKQFEATAKLGRLLSDVPKPLVGEIVAGPQVAEQDIFKEEIVDLGDRVIDETAAKAAA